MNTFIVTLSNGEQFVVLDDNLTDAILTTYEIIDEYYDDVEFVKVEFANVYKRRERKLI